jgi:hypothetical protein
MQIRIVSSREEIKEIPGNEKIVHLTFRPSVKDLLNVLLAAPKVEVVMLPRSYLRTISRAASGIMEMNHTQIIEGTSWGFRTDISPVRDLIPIEDKIKLLKIECLPYDQIITKIMRENNITEDMATYLSDKITI